MEVFITAGKQLFIVLLILVSLPLACKLLWWLRLLPLAVYFVATKLFFPAWAADHRILCLSLFAGCILFAILAWGHRIYRRKQEQQFWETQILSDPSTHYWPFPGETSKPE